MWLVTPGKPNARVTGLTIPTHRDILPANAASCVGLHVQQQPAACAGSAAMLLGSFGSSGSLTSPVAAQPLLVTDLSRRNRHEHGSTAALVRCLWDQRLGLVRDEVRIRN